MKNYFTFLLAVVIMGTSCSKSFEDLPQPTLNEVLTRSTWQITLTQGNQLLTFNNAVLAFDQRGLAVLQNQGTQAMGNWSIAKDHMNLQLHATDVHIQHLNRTWQLEAHTTTGIRLKSMDPAGEILVLTRK